MPSLSNVHRWLGGDESFRDSYARAREAQAEHYAEEIVKIADTCTDPNKARLQIDARKWYASKLDHRRYGEKVDVEAKHSGTIRVVLGGNADDPPQ